MKKKGTVWEPSFSHFSRFPTFLLGFFTFPSSLFPRFLHFSTFLTFPSSVVFFSDFSLGFFTSPLSSLFPLPLSSRVPLFSLPSSSFLSSLFPLWFLPPPPLLAATTTASGSPPRGDDDRLSLPSSLFQKLLFSSLQFSIFLSPLSSFCSDSPPSFFPLPSSLFQKLLFSSSVFVESFALTLAASNDVVLGNGSIPAFFSDTKNFTSFRSIITTTSDLDLDSTKSLRSDLKRKGVFR